MRVFDTITHNSLLQPHSSSSPHLRCDVGLEEGEYK